MLESDVSHETARIHKVLFAIIASILVPVVLGEHLGLEVGSQMDLHIFHVTIRHVTNGTLVEVGVFGPNRIPPALE